MVKCPLFPVGVNTIKELLFARLRIGEEGPGYVHFSDVLQDEYFKQLTAEKIVTRFHKGFKRRDFVKTRPRNEALDCFAYAIAAYAIIGVNVNAMAAKVSQMPVTQDKKPKIKERFTPSNAGGFANSWR